MKCQLTSFLLAAALTSPLSAAKVFLEQDESLLAVTNHKNFEQKAPARLPLCNPHGQYEDFHNYAGIAQAEGRFTARWFHEMLLLEAQQCGKRCWTSAGLVPSSSDRSKVGWSLPDKFFGMIVMKGKHFDKNKLCPSHEEFNQVQVWLASDYPRVTEWTSFSPVQKEILNILAAFPKDKHGTATARSTRFPYGIMASAPGAVLPFLGLDSRAEASRGGRAEERYAEDKTPAAMTCRHFPVDFDQNSCVLLRALGNKGNWENFPADGKIRELGDVNIRVETVHIRMKIRRLCGASVPARNENTFSPRRPLLTGEDILTRIGDLHMLPA